MACNFVVSIKDPTLECQSVYIASFARIIKSIEKGTLGQSSGSSRLLKQSDEPLYIYEITMNTEKFYRATGCAESVSRKIDDMKHWMRSPPTTHPLSFYLSNFNGEPIVDEQ